jgi:hypothetical protein
VAAFTPKELEFATFIEQCFLADNELPPYEKVADKLGFASRKEFDKMWGNPKIRNYLKKVGIDVDRIIGGVSDVLTPIQLLTLNTLLDFNDPRPFHRKLQQLGVNSRDFAAWKRDPAFAVYYKKRIQGLVDQSHEVDLALFERAIDGDITAIKFYNELTGRYRPQTAGVEVANVKLLVLKLMEVITRKLQDQPELLYEIGLELEAISVMDLGDSTPVGQVIQGQKVIGF